MSGDTDQKVHSNGSGPVNRVDEIDSRFPVLVDNVTWSGVGTSGAAATNDPGGVATQTVTTALGWNGKDPAGFLAALTASVELGQESGHVTSTWLKRTVSIQADLGALTGAQASLFARAQAVQPLIGQLIAGLEILDPALDVEDAYATRQIVQDTINDLIAELGNPGNPRVARVDTLLLILTGTPVSDNPQIVGADAVQGALGNLRTSWGLVRANSNSLADEEVVTRFVTLVDTVSLSLFVPWASQRSAFSIGGVNDQFLGPVLVLLSRDLAAAAEQCADCRMLLRSVLLGDAEQATILVNAGQDGRGAMPLTDLMDWLEDFLTQRGPRMITAGGRDAIQGAFAPMARTLRLLVDSIVDFPDPRWPQGMRASRVRSAFDSLGTFLAQVDDRVSGITRSGITVSELDGVLMAGQPGIVTLTGTGFDDLDRIELVGPDGSRVTGVVFAVRRSGDLEVAQAIVVAPSPGTDDPPDQDTSWRLWTVSGEDLVDTGRDVVIKPMPAGYAPRTRGTRPRGGSSRNQD